MRRLTLSPVVLVMAATGVGCGGPPPQGNGCRGYIEPNGFDVGQIIDEAFAGQDQNRAQRIAHRESHCIPTNSNPSGAQGLFQLINKWGYLEEACPGYPGGATEAVWSPVCNARAARIMVDRRGWGDWG